MDTNAGRPGYNASLAVFASAARTATPTAVTINNLSGKALQLIVDVTAITATPSITVAIEGYDVASAKWYSLLGSIAAIATAIQRIYRIYPGATASAGLTANDFIPKTIRISVTHGDADSITYSIGANIT